MAGKKRSRIKRAKDRVLIADLKLQGYTHNQIATQLKLSKATIKREVRKVIKDWEENSRGSVEAHKEVELARLDKVEREAWSEWERSKKDYSKEVTERLKMNDKDTGEIVETAPKVIKRESGGRLGDPKLLQIALNAHERRCKLLGLESPLKVAPTDPTGQKPYREMPVDELCARIAELQAKAMKRAA